jgi:hypothetical protein
LFRLPAAELARLQALIRSMLQFAAREPAAMAAADVAERARDTLLAGLEEALSSAQKMRIPAAASRSIATRSSSIVSMNWSGSLR